MLIKSSDRSSCHLRRKSVKEHLETMTEMIKVKLWSAARFGLLGVGIALTCVGAYLLSLQTEYKFTRRVISAYVIIACGLLAELVGVFWAICHSMKSKIYHRDGHDQNIHIYTIERPSSYPPSYEESQRSQVCPTNCESIIVMDGVDVTVSLAPPLYSLNSSEAPDCTWSWEQPPPYSLLKPDVQTHSEEQEASSGN
ncbi:transmembrane protein 252-like [Thalassophryne amazonica]|uniref:transmembrane protein 252-like n=1 Tax=Thalassophryne amazonica TaxID=390379 RepID=UPI001470D549|nr:transmembrane protein 252-like [Thalassophryne amazonica]